MGKLERFLDVFPIVTQEILQACQRDGVDKDVLSWLEQNLRHNALGGKYNRGISVVDSIELLLDRQLTTEEYEKAAILGWLVELLQAFMLVADDVMDASKTRRNSPCWYLMPGVGMMAINDALMIESVIFVVLKRRFRNEPYYIDIVELFHEVILNTEVGQASDMLTAPQDRPNLDGFNMQKYEFIVKYKTAYYSFYLSVALALYFVGKASEANLKQAETLLLRMGEYFQVQDDYLDVYADPQVLGKIGTDIQDNKCSWLINQALARCTPAQRAVLEANYGRKNRECEECVKQVFDSLNMQEVYSQYEMQTVKELRHKITQVDEQDGLKKAVFESFLDKIYKRNK